MIQLRDLKYTSFSAKILKVQYRTVLLPVFHCVVSMVSWALGLPVVPVRIRQYPKLLLRDTILSPQMLSDARHFCSPTPPVSTDPTSYNVTVYK
jgi:hypothetical protein